MVSHASNPYGLHFILPRNSTEHRPQPVTQFWTDQPLPLFGAEDAMEIGTDVSVATSKRGRLLNGSRYFVPANHSLSLRFVRYLL